MQIGHSQTRSLAIPRPAYAETDDELQLYGNPQTPARDLWGLRENTMQPSAASRKHPAPGTSPMQQSTPLEPAYQFQPLPPENPDFSNFDFSQPFNPDQTFADPSLATDNDFSYLQNTAQPPAYGNNLTPAPPPSTDLVRRAHHQQLAPQNGQQQQEQWNAGYGGNMNVQAADEEEQELDMKVQLAKRDAQGKRKQIPPFVQKLSR